MIIGGWMIAGLIAIAALASVFRPHGHHDATQSRLVVARATPLKTASSAVEGAARRRESTPERSTSTLTSPTPISTPPAALSRCDQLRTSPAWRPDDREWFLTNCLAGGSSPQVVSQVPQLGQPTASSSSNEVAPTPVPAEPTSAPPLVDTGGSARAVALAVQWLRSEAPVVYDTDASSCNAASLGSAWIATCHATLSGCTAFGACDRTITLCVALDPPAVTSARSC